MNLLLLIFLSYYGEEIQKGTILLGGISYSDEDVPK